MSISCSQIAPPAIPNKKSKIFFGGGGGGSPTLFGRKFSLLEINILGMDLPGLIQHNKFGYALIRLALAASVNISRVFCFVFAKIDL
jgi:hypothetical protein